ncbi:TniQ family protein [Pseudomonas jessenii]|uniref:TniQ family protein n=1 Tax=Pseudomonas jessenii TaxID=77298 RepID=UPI0032E3D13C
MNNVCYVATPQAWESPKGVMMRTAYHNGYRTVASMCEFLNVPCGGDGLDLLVEQSSVIRKLSMEAPQIALPLASNAYTMNNPDTAHWRIDEIFLHRSQFTRHFTYCPTCLKNELASVFSDLSGLTICPLHQILLITHCPNCQQREHWTKADLLFCKCGFDRRKAECQKGALLKEERFESFGRSLYISSLSQILNIALTCDEIWQSRKPINVRSGDCLADTIYKHVEKMLINQMARYPGFTRSMHLAPWISSHPLLVSIAEEMLEENSSINAQCVAGLCCTDVHLTMDELVCSVDGITKWPENKDFIARNFKTTHDPIGSRLYHCHTPICRMISSVNDDALKLKSQKDAIESDYFTTPEAAKLLQCSSSEVIELAELGYLKKFRPSGKRGSGHRTLIHKNSVSDFNEKYLLVGRIASALNTSPINAVRFLNQQGIASDHSKLGPHVYEAYKILDAWENLTTASANPVPLHPIVLPPTKSIHNAMRMTDINPATIEKINPPRLNSVNNATDIEERYPYTIRQAANYLNISGALLRTRFVLTGLITPETKDKISYFSLPQIQAMENHIHQHMSVEQITRYLACGYYKAAYLINLFNIRPSCALVYSNGNIQLLYNTNEIFKLKNIATQRAKKGSTQFKLATRKYIHKLSQQLRRQK